MKKTIAIICILITSAIVAFCWVNIDTAITKKSHPLQYSEYVEKYSAEYAVPKELVYAVIKTESKFKSDAVSRKGAVGLMQMTPDTFIWLCEKNGENNTDANLLYTPEVNIKYGTMYLGMLYTQFESWETALAAYNAGPKTVKEWLNDDNISKDGVLVNIPYKETDKYIKKVINAKNIYKELYFEDENK